MEDLINIYVTREISKDGYTTLGKLFINNKYLCDTLEDIPRAKKIMHQTAIPAGTYQIDWTQSPAGANGKRKVWGLKPGWPSWSPILIDVPGFSGIRIHSGNNKEHTSGCILLGIRTGDKFKRFIGESKRTTSLFAEMVYKYAYVKKRPVYITLTDAKPRTGASVLDALRDAAEPDLGKPTLDFEGAVEGS